MDNVRGKNGKGRGFHVSVPLSVLGRGNAFSFFPIDDVRGKLLNLLYKPFPLKREKGPKR